jgi:predicted ArsR family transcriptional regulator
MLSKSSREAVLETLKATPDALDAYQVAKATGLTPMQASRTLRKLEAEKAVTAIDGVNDELAARYRVATD